MADKKISQLGATITAGDPDLLAIVQGGVTKKITFSNLKSSILSSSDLNLSQVLSNGNSTDGNNVVLSGFDLITGEDANFSFGFNNGSNILIGYQSGDTAINHSITSSRNQLNWTDGIESSGLVLRSGSSIFSHSTELVLDSPFITITSGGGMGVLRGHVPDKSSISFGVVGDELIFSNDSGAFGSSYIILNDVNFELANPFFELSGGSSRLYMSHGTKFEVDSPVFHFTGATASSVPFWNGSKFLDSSSSVNGAPNMYFDSGSGIDSISTAGSDVLNIGATNANVINYGNSSTVHNFLGTAIYELQVNSYVTDKLMTLNYGGSAASGVGVGYEIQENNVITGYQKTNAARSGWSFKAPANTDYTDFVFTASVPRSKTFQDSTSTIAEYANKLSVFAATTSAELAGVISDETGFSSGALLVFSKSPAIDLPTFSTGQINSGYIEIAEQGTPATPSNALRIFADSSNRFSWIGENGFVRTFDGTANTASRIYVLPDLAGTVALGTGTANQISYWVNANALGALTTATYPDLTELSYLKGVTSALQTQLNARTRPTARWYFDSSVVSPADGSTYAPLYLNNVAFTNATTSQITATKTGAVYQITWQDFVSGTLGSSEGGTITLFNATQGTSEVLTTNHLNTKRINASHLTSTLAVSVNDMLYVLQTNPVWVGQNPTLVYKSVLITEY